MKIMVSKKEDAYSVYIPKKDLESKVVSTEPGVVFGGVWELANGMKLQLDPLEAEPQLPKTLNAKKL